MYYSFLLPFYGPFLKKKNILCFDVFLMINPLIF